MKRFFALLAVGAAAAALLPVSSNAVDTQGPACADITFGDGGYSYFATEPPSSLLDWRFDLAAPSCAGVTYTLYIYDSTGSTLLETETVSGVGGAPSISFSEAFVGATADPDGVCLVGTTSRGRHVADRAPDQSCAPLTPGGSGGVGFQ